MRFIQLNQADRGVLLVQRIYRTHMCTHPTGMTQFIKYQYRFFYYRNCVVNTRAGAFTAKNAGIFIPYRSFYMNRYGMGKNRIYKKMVVWFFNIAIKKRYFLSGIAEH